VSDGQLERWLESEESEPVRTVRPAIAARALAPPRPARVAPPPPGTSRSVEPARVRASEPVIEDGPEREEHAADLDRALADLGELTPADASDPDRRAFARAHRLHFDGAERTSALRAWDRYLARFSDGRFVPEARFNRAVCLLELRRDEEARAALRPFADGAYGGFRRREAARLLDALARGALRR
jgi:hypothetical protein